MLHDSPKGFPVLALRELGRVLVGGGPLRGVALPLQGVLYPDRLPERPVVDDFSLSCFEEHYGHITHRDAHALFLRNGVIVHGEDLQEMVPLPL